MKKIRAAVVGYGNIGKFSVEALEAAPDFEIAGIVRRQGDKDKPAELAQYEVVDDITKLKDVDVAILATPTRSCPEYAEKIVALGINTVDSFDIHTSILDYRLLMVYSFTDTAVIGTTGNFSLKNYVTLFTTEELLKMIGGTFALAFGSAFLATILGTIGAIGAFYCRKGAKHTINMVNQIPVVNAEVVTGFSLCVLLIVVCGVNKESFVPLVIGHIVLEAPFVYLSVLPKLKQMDNSIYEGISKKVLLSSTLTILSASQPYARYRLSRS